MKLKLKILTGETFEVEVDENATIRDLKKQIFRSGKTTKAVRILKGKEILPDGDTLLQHNIQDGDTVKIVIEPEKEIEITVKYEYTCSGKMSFTYKLLNETPVKSIKVLLTKERSMVIPKKEFELAVRVKEREEVIHENDLPLHFFGLDKDSDISIVKTIRSRFIINEKDETLVFDFPRHATVADLRQTAFKAMLKGDQRIVSITIFCYKTSLNKYEKMTDDEELGDFDVFYVCKNKFTRSLPNVYYKMEGNTIDGIELGDTVGSIQLRGQHQFDVPSDKLSVHVLDEYGDPSVKCDGYDVIESNKEYLVSVDRENESENSSEEDYELYP